MKITYHKDKSVTIKVTETVSHKLKSRRDMTPDLASYLRVYDAYDKVMEYLLPHEQFNDAPALRAALSAAIDGNPVPGAEILGIKVNPAPASALFAAYCEHTNQEIRDRVRAFSSLPDRHGQPWEHWEDVILRRCVSHNYHPARTSLKRTPFACICRAIKINLLTEKNAYRLMRLWGEQVTEERATLVDKIGNEYV